MVKIEKEEMDLSCQCDEDCVFNMYSLSKEKLISERSSPQTYSGNSELGRMGTDTLDGNDYTNTYWYNMGKILV